MSQEQHWAPRPWLPPDLLAGTFVHHRDPAQRNPEHDGQAGRRGLRSRGVRLLLPVMVAIGGVLLVIRGFEFNSLNVMWYDNAYGSIIWALLLLHTTHIATDWVDTIVLSAADAHAARRRPAAARRYRRECALLALRLAELDPDLRCSSTGCRGCSDEAAGELARPVQPGRGWSSALSASASRTIRLRRHVRRLPRRSAPGSLLIVVARSRSSRTVARRFLSWRVLRRRGRSAGAQGRRRCLCRARGAVRLAIILPMIAALIIPPCFE